MGCKVKVRANGWGWWVARRAATVSRRDRVSQALDPVCWMDVPTCEVTREHSPITAMWPYCVWLS